MTEQLILVPRSHVLKEILDFSNSLANDLSSFDEYIFDFQKPQFITPFGMLYLAFAIRNFLSARPTSKATAVNFEHYYAGHMGFFQACGFDFGKMPGQATGSDTYLPITIMPVSELFDETRSEMIEIGETIERHSRKLSKVLVHQDDGALVDMLTYTIREMIRNVVEHSQSESVAYCAQYKPSTKQAEVAILDTGIGIRASLANNPHLKIKDDHEALNLALMPGISGKMFKGKKRDPYDPWQNSGYGLYAVSRLCGLGGKFLICSGDTGLSLKPEKKEYHFLKFQGTALRLNLCSKDIKHLQTVLSKIMKEGDLIAKQFLGEENTQASSASKMLSSEFIKQSKKK